MPKLNSQIQIDIDNFIKNREFSKSQLSSISSPFIYKKDLASFCFEFFGVPIDEDKLDILVDLFILPVFIFEKQKFVLKEDISSLLSCLKFFGDKNDSIPNYDKLFEIDSFRIGDGTIVDLINKNAKSFTFYSAIRNLIVAHKEIKNPPNKSPISFIYFEGSRITTYSKDIFHISELQHKREQLSDMTSTSQFARSAYYMGTKRALCGFIVEALSSAIPENGVALDLMCGSGVVSGALSRFWKTYSSDAQEFCTTLAVVHGGGFSREAAQNLISKLFPSAKHHFNELLMRLENMISLENDFFFRETDQNLKNDYHDFIKSFPTFSNGIRTAHWDPQVEVKCRKENNKAYPYCLFTTYFSNVYFGLRQCAEIDSLRFAIDQLEDEKDKKWALGALIATLSAIGTTYAGHFAQPSVRNYEDISINKLSKIIDQRSPSITHEFIIRLLNLAERSQSVSNQINVLEGPWQTAILSLSEIVINKPVIVYLDAPYKREEFSRYYHVLETLIQYNYPTCTGAGLTPKPGERFRSKFFTKTQSKVTYELVNIIVQILDQGWICAWSYADTGDADIGEIIFLVDRISRCSTRTYSVPFIHKSQGGVKPKVVTEYLIIFTPKKAF